MPLPIEKSALGKIPALRLSILFLAGILIAYWGCFPSIASLLLLLALLIASLVIRRARNSLLMLSIVVAGIFSYEVRNTPMPSITRFLNEWTSVEGVICNEPKKIGEKLQFELKTETLYRDGGTHELSGKILVRSDAMDLDYGDRIRVSGVLLSPLPKKNPGEFDYKAYLASRGIYSILNCDRAGSITSLSARSSGNPFIRKVVLPLRRFLREAYSKTLCGETRAFLEGITLGEKERLSPKIRELFAKAGIYHILAVSGLHVGIVAFIIFTLLGVLRVPRRVITPTVIGILILYGFVTYLRPSVVRATIMMGVFLLGYSMERNVNLLNLLGVALLIILLTDPSSPFDLSFQLSFAATASIILILDKLRITKSLLHKWLYLPVFISLAAQAGTAPIVAYHFFRLPLLTTMVNLFVVPGVTFSLALGFISSISTLISLEVARMFAAANWLIIRFILKLVEIFGSFKYAEIITGKPPVQFILAYFLIFGLVLHMKKAWVRKVLVFTTLIMANLFVWQKVFASASLRITFLSVEGSPCIVETPNYKTILIDYGSKMNSCERVIAPALWEKGIEEIDLLLLTRPIPSKGTQYLFQNFKIGRLVTPMVPYGAAQYIRVLQLSQEYNLDYLGTVRGDKILLDGVRLTFHYPTSDLIEFATVFEVDYENFNLLWWGEEVHGGSKLNLHPRYDVVKFDSPVSSGMEADLAICESPRDVQNHFFNNLIFTKGGAVSIASDGDTFWVEQVFHQQDRLSR